MIDAVEPFNVGDRVKGAAGSRLCGMQGWIVSSGVIWSFVRMAGSGCEEYTKTALLEVC